MYDFSYAQLESIAQENRAKSRLIERVNCAAQRLQDQVVEQNHKIYFYERNEQIFLQENTQLKTENETLKTENETLRSELASYRGGKNLLRHLLKAMCQAVVK